MHDVASPRRQSPDRRQQIMRRRFAAVLIVGIVVLLGILAALAIPSATPGQVPSQKGITSAAVGVPAKRDITVATVAGCDVLLPVRAASTTAIAFHPVDVPHGVSMKPQGEHISGGLGSGLAGIFTGNGGVGYYLMDADGNDVSSATAGLDVGAPPGSTVLSPVDGRIAAVRSYQVQGSHEDSEIDIQLTDPSVMLMVTHIVPAADVNVGDRVAAGYTLLGRVRQFPRTIEQSISQYTNDSGDHVQLITVRVPTDLAGF
jgi:hypothetical protein